jgi:hypothetical protein
MTMTMIIVMTLNEELQEIYAYSGCVRHFSVGWVLRANANFVANDPKFTFRLKTRYNR